MSPALPSQWNESSLPDQLFEPEPLLTATWAGPSSTSASPPFLVRISFMSFTVPPSTNRAFGDGLSTVLPLPGGEGWGEGERSTVFLSADPTFNCPEKSKIGRAHV